MSFFHKSHPYQLQVLSKSCKLGKLIDSGKFNNDTDVLSDLKATGKNKVKRITKYILPSEFS